MCDCCGVGMLHCRVYVCGRFHHKKAVVLKVLASIHLQMYNCVFNSTWMYVQASSDIAPLPLLACTIFGYREFFVLNFLFSVSINPYSVLISVSCV